MEINTNKMILNNLILSKYNQNSITSFPKIINCNFTVALYYKQKHKYFLFINIMLLLLFVNPYIKTRFFFKTSPINIIQINLRGQNTILNFMANFIEIYFPLIDSFLIEFKFSLKHNTIKFNFFKFPLLFELNILFLSLEHLYLFINNYKFQLEFNLKKKKN